MRSVGTMATDDADTSDAVSIEDEYSAALNNTDNNNSSDVPLGVFASPSLVLAFYITSITSAFALNVLQALSGIWPADVLFLITTIYGAILWYFAVRLINSGILARQPMSRWVRGWQHIVGFISHVLIFIVALYSIQMLRMLWVSGMVTVIQSIVVTVIGIEVLVFVFIAVKDQYSPEEIKRLNRLVWNHIEKRRRRHQYNNKTKPRRRTSPSFLPPITVPKRD